MENGNKWFTAEFYRHNPFLAMGFESLFRTYKAQDMRRAKSRAREIARSLGRTAELVAVAETEQEVG